MNFFEILTFRGGKKAIFKKDSLIFSASPPGLLDPRMPRAEAAGYFLIEFLRA